MPRYAAIDIGSNSIRMEAAEVVDGAPPRILASEREVTRLGESVFRTGRFTEDAIELSVACWRGWRPSIRLSMWWAYGRWARAESATRAIRTSSSSELRWQSARQSKQSPDAKKRGWFN